MIFRRAKFSEQLESEPNRRQCVDCLSWSPITETNYTLISAQHGWRLTRSIDESGKAIMQWRCPDCFKQHRAGAQKK